MAAPTYSQLLDAYMSAALALSTSQSYRMPDGRELTRADLPAVRETIDWLEKKIAASDLSVDQTGTGMAVVTFNR